MLCARGTGFVATLQQTTQFCCPCGTAHREGNFPFLFTIVQAATMAEYNVPVFLQLSRRLDPLAAYRITRSVTELRVAGLPQHDAALGTQQVWRRFGSLILQSGWFEPTPNLVCVTLIQC